MSGEQELRMFEIMVDALNQAESECGCKIMELTADKKIIHVALQVSGQYYEVIARKVTEQRSMYACTQ